MMTIQAKEKRNSIRSGKEKDMTIMNRLYNPIRKCSLSAHLAKRGMGLCFVPSSIDKHKRGNYVIDTVWQ